MDWRYVAGFFDGEGSLHRIRKNTSVQLRFDNTCEEVLIRIRVFIGHGTVSNRGRQKPHHKDRYRLTITDHVVIARAPREMMPYLVVKRGKALEILTYIDGRKWRSRKKRPRS